MMKIALISLVTPTPENCRAASALPFHLAKFRAADVDLRIWSFNSNQVTEEQRQRSEQALGTTISYLPVSSFVSFLQRPTSILFRALVRRPFLSYLKMAKPALTDIKTYDPDCIWIYGEDISHLAKLFPGKTCVITTPDCEALYYHRVVTGYANLEMPGGISRYKVMERKYVRMTRHFPTGSAFRYHLVGKADADYIRTICPGIDAHFIVHPHYDAPASLPASHFHAPKIKILIAGRCDAYMGKPSRELVDMLCANADLSGHYELTFLGKGWESLAGRLKQAGYQVNHIVFAPVYMEELQKHDIQITPICVGTGTKGKVLDAFVNGLMVIGTPRALENIQVRSGVSCIEYDDADKLAAILRDIPANVAKYEAIRDAGVQAVLQHHNRQKVADEFFSLFRQ